MKCIVTQSKSVFSLLYIVMFIHTAIAPSVVMSIGLLLKRIVQFRVNKMYIHDVIIVLLSFISIQLFQYLFLALCKSYIFYNLVDS